MEIRGRWATRQVWVGEKELRPEQSFQVGDHRASGFGWGYIGSGPEQLALALLLELTDAETARRWYQELMWQLIAPLPRADFTVDVQVITDVIGREVVGEPRAGDEQPSIAQPTAVEVEYRYTREELQALFDVAHSEHVARGGRYAVHSGTLTIYTQPGDTDMMGAESARMGSFAAVWGQGNQIWQIELDVGFSLEDLLEELGTIEEKALGRKIYGR